MENHVMQYQTVHFTLNGKAVERTVDVRASLTDMLRNDYRMTSVKKGCEVGECGACTVIMDGEAFNFCIYLAVWAEGKHITTLEGLPYIDCAFETASALATVGVTAGITTTLGRVSQSILILFMYLGRVGVFSASVAFAAGRKPAKIQYPSAELMIG